LRTTLASAAVSCVSI